MRQLLNLGALLGIGVLCAVLFACNSNFKEVGGSPIDKDLLTACQGGKLPPGFSNDVDERARACDLAAQEIQSSSQAKPLALTACQLNTESYQYCVLAWGWFGSYNAIDQKFLVDKAWSMIQNPDAVKEYNLYLQNKGVSPEVAALSLTLINTENDVKCRAGVASGYCAGLAYAVAARDPGRNKEMLHDLAQENCKNNGATINCNISALALNEQAPSNKAEEFQSGVSDYQADVAETERTTRQFAHSETEYNQAVAGAVGQGLIGAANTLALAHQLNTPIVSTGKPYSGANAAGLAAGISAICEGECRPLKQACEGQPPGQSACYRAAACTCGCFLQHDTRPTSPQVEEDHQQWQQCVTQNRANAQSLR